MAAARRLRLHTLALALGALASCTPPRPPAPPPTTWATTVRVLEAGSQRLLPGAQIAVAGRTYTADAQGGIWIPGIPLAPSPTTFCAIAPDHGEACTSAVRGQFTEVHVLLPRLPPPTPVLRPATRAELLDVRGNFCNLPGAPYFTVNYTPALAGAPDDAFDQWMRQQVAEGSTHVFVGPFDPGPIYPTIPWASPDLKADRGALRAFLQKIRGYQTVRGHGMIPVLFLHGGGPGPRPYIDQWWPEIAEAIDGFADQVLVVPAWEPEAWTAAEISYGLTRAHQLFPQAPLAYHNWPTRWVGCSNPPQPDDPWLGPDGTCDELSFYRKAGGEHVELVFYQAPHGLPLWEDCDESQERCWLDRWQDGVMRIGAGERGWPIRKVVGYEFTAFESFRGQVTQDQARQAATHAARICKKWNVACGWGNGLPLH